jgi:hypothetical protein
MDQPANHPGALADVGCENDMYQVDGIGSVATGAWIQLTNVSDASALYSLRKVFLLSPGSKALVVRYELPESVVPAIGIEVALSPDYYRLLREGRRAVRPVRGVNWRGFRAASATAWLARASDEATEWAVPRQETVGHGLCLRVRAHTQRFHLLLGCGETDDETCERLLAEGREALLLIEREAAGLLAARASASAPPPPVASPMAVEFARER